MTQKKRIHRGTALNTLILLIVFISVGASASGEQATITYENTLKKIENPRPILADYPEYVEPLKYESRYLAPRVVDEKDGELLVRSWRFWSNAHGIVEMENRLEAKATAIINVFAWGVDDGQGVKTPQPAGVVLLGTPEKNKLIPEQIEEVVNPFLHRLRKHILLVGHTLPGREERIRKLLYPSISTKQSDLDVERGEKLLVEALRKHRFEGPPLKTKLTLDADTPLTSYFLKTTSYHSSDTYNSPGFKELPVPLAKDIARGQNDIIFYDDEGYTKVRNYLKSCGIRHILLMGFLQKRPTLPTHPMADDGAERIMGFIKTACNLEDLSKDFNVFLVGDAMRTTYPGSTTPKFATQAALAKVSGNHMITQVNWVKIDDRR